MRLHTKLKKKVSNISRDIYCTNEHEEYKNITALENRHSLRQTNNCERIVDSSGLHVGAVEGRMSACTCIRNTECDRYVSSSVSSCSDLLLENGNDLKLRTVTEHT